MTMNKFKEEKLKRQQEVFQYYIQHLLDKGEPPTASEIGRKFMVTRERARQILDNMVEEGFLIRLKSKHIKHYPNVEMFIKNNVENHG